MCNNRTVSDTANRLRKRVVERVLHARGVASGDARRAAFDARGSVATAGPLVDKVARNAWKVTDEDVAAARRAGHSDDELFEIVVCAAVGQATRQLDHALAMLAGAEDQP